MRTIKGPRHPQFWYKEGSEPRLNDALRVVQLAFDLLSSALPMAIKNIGSAAPHDQLRFWWDFIEFEKETDLDGSGGLSAMDIDGIRRKLSDWATVARERMETPKGSLYDEGDAGRTEDKTSEDKA